MSRSRTKLVTALVVAAVTLSGVVTFASPASAAGSQLSYIVMPHPDDEFQGWSLIGGSSGNNKVFIYATSGDETSACARQDQGTGSGPYWYQGPSSPVGQPNYGEVAPLRSPWNNDSTGGKSKPACVDSRRHSTRQFLAAQAFVDATIPNFSTSPSTKCFSGDTRAGIPPRRKDFGDGTGYTSNCALVYPSSNGYGTLVFFDLGDGDLTAEEVEWAVLAVKNNKSYVGVQNSPDANAIGGYRNAVQYKNLDGSVRPCHVYDHTDHKAVHVALYNWSMGGIPVRWGRTCQDDPDALASTGRVSDVAADLHFRTWEMSGNQRVGAGQQQYGWLWPTFWGTDLTGYDKAYAQRQAFWGRR